jgi:hypothetical protein
MFARAAVALRTVSALRAQGALCLLVLKGGGEKTERLEKTNEPPNSTGTMDTEWTVGKGASAGRCARLVKRGRLPNFEGNNSHVKSEGRNKGCTIQSTNRPAVF